MKRSIPIITVLMITFSSCEINSGPVFSNFFEDGTLRIDYFHSGNAISETVKIDNFYSYDTWAGSKSKLLDQLNYGSYYYKIYDQKKGQLIYSKGFDSYFKEYQLTTPAINGIIKQFHESAIIPFPKRSIEFVLEKRSNDGIMMEVYRTIINPADAIEAISDPEVHVYTSLDNGNPNIKADVLIVGEGYTKDEEQKFQDDLHRFTGIFFKAEPCKSFKDHFNIRGVLKPSIDSGVDEPGGGIDKNTAVNASFNALGSERYLLTEDNKSLRDIAGHAPYDALYIMVNHSRYGGGGIYNFYCVYTSDNIDSEYLMVHEFGHSFFGLADEYYTSSTAYNDFYPQGYEPNEPNITALLDPENLKWKHLLTKGIEVPTPWGKKLYDSLDNAWQLERMKMNNEIAGLRRTDASEKEIYTAIERYNLKSIKRNKEVEDFLEHGELAGKVGAFEGAGYASSGLYRSSINCIMFSRTDYFCPVCQEAMIRVIKSYSE